MKRGSSLHTFFSLLPGRALLLSFFYGAIRILVSAAWPLLLYNCLKQIGTKNHTHLPAQLTVVLILLLLAALASRKQSIINIALLKAFSLELTDRVWKKMNALDWLSFHKNNRVYYFDLLMVETWRMRTGLSALLEVLIINSFIAGVFSILIAFISWPLFLMCLGGLAVMAAGNYLSMIKTRPLMKRFHQAWRDQHLWIASSVDQYDLVKLDRAYAESAAKNRANSTAFLEASSALLHLQAKWRTINQLLGNVVRIAVFVAGIYWVQAGYAGFDDLLLVLLLVSIVQANALQIPGALLSFMETQEAQKVLSEFFARPDEKTALPASSGKAETIHSITVRNVTYRYGDQVAIENLRIHLERGRIYLWKGRNGSGKTTTAQILLGLLQPQSGSLAINGLARTWEDLKSLRSRFAYLNQDSPIFTGSIKENTLFGHPYPQSAWQTMNSSWLAGLMPFPEQEADRQVGERGEGLSGGEGKRIALIRELLRSSGLLVLDEPLNHLDEFAIHELQRELVQIKAQTIIIIISHQKGFEDIADEIRSF